MAKRVTAVDRGTHNTKVMTLRTGKHGLIVERFVSMPSQDADLAGLGFKLSETIVGLAGRDLSLRYTQVPPAPDWQLRRLMELEIEDLKSQTGDDLSADYNLLPIIDEDAGMETVLLAIAKNRGLVPVTEMVEAAGGKVSAHVPNGIAIYNAYLRCGPVQEEGVTCLVNIGYETTDIAIVRGVDLIFVRNLSSGGKVFDEAISSAFNVGPRKAQELKRDLLDLDPASRGRYSSGQAEKVTMSAGGASSMIVSAIQSSIAFCKTQTKDADLQVDRLLISGGTSRCRGIKGMLTEILRCPVQIFDPFLNIDLASLPDQDAGDLEQMRAEAVVALGLCVGKLDDSLYQCEILPEAVKRRRAFMQRGIFNYAAAVVAALLLVIMASSDSQQADAAQRASSIVRAKESRLKKTHQEAATLLASNRATRVLVADLAARALPLTSALLTLRALEQTMPSEAWIETLEIRRPTGRIGVRATGDTRAVLTGRIRGVFGGDIGEIYRKFLNDFKRWDFVGRTPKVISKPDTSDRNETLFTWQVDLSAEEKS